MTALWILNFITYIFYYCYWKFYDTLFSGNATIAEKCWPKDGMENPSTHPPEQPQLQPGDGPPAQLGFLQETSELGSSTQERVGQRLVQPTPPRQWGDQRVLVSGVGSSLTQRETQVSEGDKFKIILLDLIWTK